MTNLEGTEKNFAALKRMWYNPNKYMAMEFALNHCKTVNDSCKTILNDGFVGVFCIFLEILDLEIVLFRKSTLTKWYLEWSN